MKLEENGTMSLKVIYESKSLSFKTLFLGGHLLENQKRDITKFNIPLGNVNAKNNVKNDVEEMISFDFVQFEGGSLKLYYVGFSKQQPGI